MSVFNYLSISAGDPSVRATFLIGCVVTLFTMVGPSASFSAEPESYDVVVYGGTSAGVIAAVQVKKMGKTVIVVGPDQHLGGLTSGGLGWTDSGNKNAIGGLSREFYQRVWKHYQKPEAWKQQKKSDFGNRNQSPPAKDGDSSSMWVFEPHAAELVFEDFVREFKVPVHRDEWLDREKGVTLKEGRITEIRMISGKRYRGKMFIDATYEGDLLAAAEVDYHVGREANSVYDEKWNGIQVGVLHHAHYFKSKVDPYKVPGDPSSGVLPGISEDDPGQKGDGDHRIQAYCFRMCLTNDDRNRVPFPKPDGYDPAQYALLLRVYATGRRDLFNKFDPIQNHKTDTNNHGPFSTDYIGMNYDYPEESYDRRKEIIADHRRYQQGLMYFMANDAQVPEDVRNAMSRWGLAKDEFTDNDNWPHQIYVREARRMVGKYVMTEHDCLDAIETPESVGMGSYTLDSHNVQRYVTPNGTVQNEGDIGVHAPRPYKISYGSIVPKSGQCENLLVPVCVSSSHIAFGSIRMEPVFMVLGQSAATAASIAIDKGVAVQEVPYQELRRTLLNDGQVLELVDSRSIRSRDHVGMVDDRNAKLTGNWSRSTTNAPFVDQGYQHDGNVDKGSKSAQFTSQLAAGEYEVLILYPPNTNRATNVPVTVQFANGTKTVKLNQRTKHDGKGQSIGRFLFDGTATVEISNKETDGHVIIDAVHFQRVHSALCSPH